MKDKAFRVDRDILMFSIRYAIGRQTFAPTTVIENTKHNIDEFTKSDLEIIIRDIDGHMGSYGMDFDKRNWMDFKDYLQSKINE